MGNQIPIVDLRRFESDREAFVSEVCRGYREFGFCGLTHHGISDAQIDNAYGAFRAFFDQPQEIKLGYATGLPHVRSTRCPGPENIARDCAGPGS